MITILTTILCILTLFLLGDIVPAIKKILGLFTKLLLKITNLFGIKIKSKEKSVKVSDEFKATYKEIRTVKISKKNLKQKSSIDYLALTVLLIALILLVINNMTSYAISNWIYSIIAPLKIVSTSTDMRVYYTAIIFSVVSFSLSRMLSTWKSTKKQRLELKEAKLKKKAASLMSSKELVDLAEKKDAQKLKELEKDDKE